MALNTVLGFDIDRENDIFPIYPSYTYDKGECRGYSSFRPRRIGRVRQTVMRRNLHLYDQDQGNLAASLLTCPITQGVQIG